MCAAESLSDIVKHALKDAQSVTDSHDLHVKRNAYLGKKGVVSLQLRSLGNLSPEERKKRGALLHVVQKEIKDAFEIERQKLETEQDQQRLLQERVDITLPSLLPEVGYLHPVTRVMMEIVAIFKTMGFSVLLGPEIEDDFHNFTSLNIPPHHPARAMHDTFYLEAKGDDHEPLLLRTHTSPVQMRAMRSLGVPLAILAPGRTYRRDSDPTHTPMFHQIEGLVVRENVTLGDLKGCLNAFCRAFFDVENLPLRMRPSFFPFTSPSAEIDIGCTRTKEGIVLGGEDWMEVLGCGMVHEVVLRHGGCDPSRYRGFAFGLGVERLAMLKYGMADLRAFFDGDHQWLDHYGFSPFAA